MNFNLIAVLICVICLTVVVGPADAGTWYILPDGTGVAPTIQAGIDSAAAGDTLLLAAGTYTGPGNRESDFGGKELVLTSESGAAATIIDCQNLGGAFLVLSGEGPGLIISDITVTNALVGAAQMSPPESRDVEEILLSESALVFGAAVNIGNGSPTIRGNVFSNCTASVAGAVYVGVGTPWIEGNTIDNCSASYGGGIYYGPSSDPLIENNTIQNCTATSGGGVFCGTNGEVLSNTIQYNSVTGQGGGICCVANSQAYVAFNTIRGNHAERILVAGAGGGMYCAEGSEITVEGNLFIANESIDQTAGAGLALYQCGGHVVSNTFRENIGAYGGGENSLGGGLWSRYYTGIIENNEFDANDAGGGAAVYISCIPGNRTDFRNNIFRNHNTLVYSPLLDKQFPVKAVWGNWLTMENCTFIDNPSGGASLRDESNAIGCTFIRNSAHNDDGNETGGAILADRTTRLQGCLFYGNSADLGGALYMGGDPGTIDPQTPLIENCTFSDNSGTGANIATRITNETYRLYIYNSIFAFSTDGGYYCDGYWPVLTCCNVYQSDSPACYGPGGGGNISVDPWFCDRSNGYYTLAMDSPCAPANNSCGVQIGALPVGCGPVPVMFAAVHATAVDGAVEIRWDVIADEPIAGFDIYRRVDSSDRELRVNTAAPVAGGSNIYRDDTVRPSTAYTYRIVATTPDGTELSSRTATVTTRPGRLMLEQNTPNPFNPSTTISYTLPTDTPVEVAVYDALGRRVATLVTGVQNTGPHDVVWNGRDHRGQPAGSGVYFVKLVAGKRTLTRKMLLLK